MFPGGCGVLTGVARLHGRSPRGERARGVAPCGRWTHLSVLGALGREGILAAMSVEAATGGAVFHAHLGRVLLPEPRRAEPDSHRLATRIWRHGLLLQQPALTTQDPAANASGRLEGSA